MTSYLQYPSIHFKLLSILNILKHIIFKLGGQQAGQAHSEVPILVLRFHEN